MAAQTSKEPRACTAALLTAGLAAVPMRCLVGPGVKQNQADGESLQDAVTGDAAYQHTVRGKPPADHNKEVLTLQGTIGTPGSHNQRTGLCHQRLQHNCLTLSPATFFFSELPVLHCP